MAEQSDSENAKTVGADGLAYGLRVHQATGMVAAQTDSGVAVALALIVAYASAHDATVDEIAERVITRQLRFD
jgi:hypothetical protein